MVLLRPSPRVLVDLERTEENGLLKQLNVISFVNCPYNRSYKAAVSYGLSTICSKVQRICLTDFGFKIYRRTVEESETIGTPALVY